MGARAGADISPPPLAGEGRVRVFLSFSPPPSTRKKTLIPAFSREREKE
jgi:hypothetical protein